MIVPMGPGDFGGKGTNLDELEGHFRGDIHAFRIMIPSLLMPPLDGQRSRPS